MKQIVSEKCHRETQILDLVKSIQQTVHNQRFFFTESTALYTIRDELRDLEKFVKGTMSYGASQRSSRSTSVSLEDKAFSQIKQLEKELKRALRKISELERKLDNEGEIIAILNEPLSKDANMTFSAITPDSRQNINRSVSPVPRLNLTQVKYGDTKEEIDFEGYSEKLEN